MSGKRTLKNQEYCVLTLHLKEKPRQQVGEVTQFSTEGDLDFEIGANGAIITDSHGTTLIYPLHNILAVEVVTKKRVVVAPHD